MRIILLCVFLLGLLVSGNVIESALASECSHRDTFHWQCGIVGTADCAIFRFIEYDDDCGEGITDAWCREYPSGTWALIEEDIDDEWFDSPDFSNGQSYDYKFPIGCTECNAVVDTSYVYNVHCPDE